MFRQASTRLGHRLHRLFEHGPFGAVELDFDDALDPLAPITTGTPT